MNTKNLINEIQQNAEKLVQKNELIHQTFKNRDQNRQAWEHACADFHDSYDALAFPGGLKKGIELLKQQDPATISTAIIYLHADPYFHRSGYIKQTIVRLLKKSTLSAEQNAQLHQVLLLVIQHNSRREFIEFCRLANKIKTAEFAQQIQKISATSDDARLIARAEQMLTALNK